MNEPQARVRRSRTTRRYEKWAQRPRGRVWYDSSLYGSVALLPAKLNMVALINHCYSCAYYQYIIGVIWARSDVLVALLHWMCVDWVGRVTSVSVPVCWTRQQRL